MQTHQIATAPTDQLPVCLSACHHWVSVQVLQACLPPLYAAAGSPARLLCSYTYFAQVKMTPSSSQREAGASLPLLCLFLPDLPLVCVSKCCCTSSTPSPPRCGSCSSPWLDAGSSLFWRLRTPLRSEPGHGAGARRVCGNEQSLGNQQRRHPPFPAPGSLPFLPTANKLY